MKHLNPYIKIGDVVSTSREILEEINPEVYLYSSTKGNHYTDFNALADIGRINNAFDCLLATGYNVLKSNNTDMIKFTFEDNLKLDFKYMNNFKQFNYNPIDELIHELGVINCHFDDLLDIMNERGKF